MKGYRKKNKRKIAARKAAYYKKNKHRIAARNKIFYKRNRRKILAQKTIYGKKNRHRISIRQAIWGRTPQGRASWRAHGYKRRTLKLSMPCIIHETRAPTDGRCPCCRVKMISYHRKHAPSLDHIVALNDGGHHIPGNTWIICRSCNSTKNDKPLSYLLDRLKLSKAARRRVYRIVRSIRRRRESSS